MKKHKTNYINSIDYKMLTSDITTELSILNLPIKSCYNIAARAVEAAKAKMIKRVIKGKMDY